MIYSSRSGRAVTLLFAALIGLESGCIQAVPAPDERKPTENAVKEEVASPSSLEASKQHDLNRLAKLWQDRTQDKSVTEHPVGPGDVIEVSVPAIEELRSRVVRISGDGTISLPFIGKIEAAGRTEEELRVKLVELLEKYMYNPRVSLFVREYRSRQVAVLGAVFKPGLYSLNSGGDTILDLLSQAGGTTSGADPRLYFIPAESVDEDQAKQIAATLPNSVLSQDPSPLILKRTDPILIDMKDLALGGHQHYLSLTVRPGDIIMVPGGGQVLVEGWVEKPGAYNVSPGLTVSGAVVAAGGLLYPADNNSVKVIRSEKGGKRTIIMADLDKIKMGNSPDIALQGGDIVDVSATVTSRLIPYGVYRFFTSVINVGVGGTIPLVSGS